MRPSELQTLPSEEEPETGGAQVTLVVTYDLTQPLSKYKTLFETLREQASWWHYLPDTRMVSTDLSAKELLGELSDYLFDGDRLLVVKLVSGYAGWLPRKAWDWIEGTGATGRNLSATCAGFIAACASLLQWRPG
jgi:hypothetical protein